MIGKTISHYKILDKLGEGGMGIVYKAQDTKLGRDVALKTLPEEFAQDVDRVTRFKREAKLLASLNHPNIAAIHGLEEEEVRFLVLEMVEGETLAERLLRGAFSVEEALEICRQIAEAFEAAHERGIIHRDLKPSNVKITPEGKVKVLDFGLAKALEAADYGEVSGVDLSKSPTITAESSSSGVILGTAAYMSPEQARGKPLDKRTDIWAFGCVVYELLTGRRAFGGETVTDIIATIIKGEPDWEALPEDTPWNIRTLLRRCLQKDSHQRLHDIADARIEIEEALASPEILRPDLTAPGRTRMRWRQIIPWILASLVLGAIIAGIVVWRVIRPGPVVPAAVSRFVITPPPTAPLTNRSGLDVVISPDGTRIAFLGEQEGRRMLYVRKLDELEARVIPGTENAADPFFSPDGKWVGFDSGRLGKLMKVMLSGGSTIAISDEDSRGAAWGPDNNIILAKGDGLWRVPAGGGKPAEKITQGNQVCSGPRILPGGRAVIFSVVAAGSTGIDEQVGVFFLETGELKILLQGTRPHYAPSGHLIFAREGALMAAPFDLERLEVTGDAVPLIEDVRWSPGTAVDFDLSENGTLVYVPGGDGAGIKRKLVWVDRRGKEEVLAAEPHQYGRLRFSPDGKRLAVAVRHLQNRDVYIYDLRREILSRLTFHPASDTFPLWTRDGLRVVFASSRDGGIYNLYWKAADGTGQVDRLTTSPNLQIPQSLSPDGTKLVITERNPGTNIDIFVLSLKDEHTSSPLIQTPFVESHPSVSPDGRWIAYYSNESGQDEVYVRPFPNVDQGKWQVSSDGGTEPLWIPDGRGLFYRDSQKMMKVTIEAEPTFTYGKPEVLFELEGRYLISSPGQHHDISPDGQRFLMITEDEQSETAPAEIIVVLNWFEELRQLVPIRK